MPNSNSELYILHAWEDNPIYLKCVQGESGIKIAKFQLVDDNGAINLTGNTGIVFMGTSGNGSAVSVNCTVDSATDGKVSLSASTNFTNAIGNTKGNIVVNFSGDNIQFDGITIKVSPNKAIKALMNDTTFATFLSALSKLQNMAANTFVEVSNPTGNPKSQHYYEIVNNSYVLSNDTTVDANKTYYYSESRTLTTIDNALDENSTNPVQNSAVATAINNIINRLDSSEFVKVVTNNDADACNQANILYKLYINGMYHYAFCSVATNQLTQYVFKQNGGIIFRTAPATNGTQSGTWGDFKEVAIKGTSLADYGITNAYTKDQTYSKAEVYNKTEINSKVATINQNHNTLATQVASNKTAIEGRMDAAESNITNQGSRLTTAEGEIVSQGDRLTTAEGSIANQGLRLTSAESKIATYGNRLANAEGNITNQGSRLTNAESNIASQGGRLTSVEETIVSHSSRIGSAETNISNAEQRLTNVESGLNEKAGQSYVDTELAKKLNNSEGSVSRANIANKAINEDKLTNTIVAKINNAMSNKFLSVTSFMCDEDGTIFAATDDTVLTNQSFENQDKTENPYFIWIANTVTEVQNNAFVNTGKVVKIYCENTIENTPLPNNYRSLPIEYGVNSLFAYYIMRSLVTLFNDKADKTDVQGSVADIDSRISSLESNKANATDVYNRTEIDNALGDIKYAYETRFELKYAVGFDEHGIPVVIWTGSYIPSNCFSNTNIETIFISNNVSSIATDAFTCWSNLTENDSVFLYIDKGYSEAVEILGDSVSERVNVYYKGEFNATNLMISTLKYLYEYFDEQLATKLNDSDNVIETNHIKNSAVTEEKLSAGLQAKINKNTAVYSKTFLASGWNNKQQTFTLPNSYTVTNNTKVDIEGDDTVIDQLVIDDCRGIYVINNNGTLILKAMDNSPTENITVQLIVYEVENLN